MRQRGRLADDYEDGMGIEDGTRGIEGRKKECRAEEMAMKIRRG